MASLKDQHYHIKFFMLSVLWGLCTILNKMCIEKKFLGSSNEAFFFQNILLVTEVAHTVEGGG